MRRAGKYTPIVKGVLDSRYGEIGSIIVKVQHNCTNDHKQYGKMEGVPIRHEFCVVFKKLDQSGAERREHLGAVLPSS